MKMKDTWKARWENSVLHIEGMTDLFPNNYSTSSLNRGGLCDKGKTLMYSIVFHRDKEPFCNQDLVGPVHFFEQELPKYVTHLRILGTGSDYVDILVPDRATNDRRIITAQQSVAVYDPQLVAMPSLSLASIVYSPAVGRA